MIELKELLPAVNAGLNGTAALLLGAGYAFIRRRRVAAHRSCMLAAFGASALFLADYLYYHFVVGSERRFEGAAWLRPIYLFILFSHIVLAVVIVPMILTTLLAAFRERWDTHRRWARRTFPLWMYVSVTGLAVYWMLYRM